MQGGVWILSCLKISLDFRDHPSHHFVLRGHPVCFQLKKILFIIREDEECVGDEGIKSWCKGQKLDWLFPPPPTPNVEYSPTSSSKKFVFSGRQIDSIHSNRLPVLKIMWQPRMTSRWLAQSLMFVWNWCLQLLLHLDGPIVSVNDGGGVITYSVTKSMEITFVIHSQQLLRIKWSSRVLSRRWGMELREIEFGIYGQAG